MARDDSSTELRIRRHHERGELKEAATAAVEGFGPEILGLLVAIIRDEQLAGEVFAQFCEDLSTGLAGFGGGSSFRTWAYALARNAWLRLRREPHFRKTMALPDHPAISEAEQKVRTASLPHARPDPKQQVVNLRQSLDPEDQMLLILRIDRAMSWNDIGLVMLGPDEARDDDAIFRKATALRKRFDRVKDDLKHLARERNLLGKD